MTKKIPKIFKVQQIQPNKAYGQNFLIDLNIVKKIIQTSKVSHQSQVLEIGAGLGHLTESLLVNSKMLFVVEIDQKLIPILQQKFISYQNLKIINDDFLKVDLKDLFHAQIQNKEKLKVVANLPYYLTSPILFKLLKDLSLFDSLTLMMQKEVAMRLVAQPGTKSYNNLSIMMQYYCDLKIAFDVKPQSFYPIPKVTSSVVQFEVKPNRKNDIEQMKVWNFIRLCFSSKRKTLINNLSKLVQKQVAIELMEQLNWSLNLRAETMSYEMFFVLFQAIERLNK